ncbi:MAG: site-specific integrase, partial [Candidatus Bathyarchaeia archaeon]
MLMVSGRPFFEEVLRLDPKWRASGYRSVQNWIGRLRRGGSLSTLEAYFKFLAWFVGYARMSPDEFLRLRKEEMEGLVQGFCDRYSEEGKKASASNAMKAIRSFLRANRVRVEELELDDSYRWMRRPEYVPTKDEVYRMASVAGLKWRAIILCLFQSGLRNSALRALTYGLLRDQVEGGATPIRVHVTEELRRVLSDACKEGVEYWTFFGREASEALRQYLAYRREIQGEIGDDELLFPSDSRSIPRELRGRVPIDKWGLTKELKKIARKAGIRQWESVRTHSLRKTFRAVLDAGYIDGGQMAEDDKEYLMGHRLPGAKAPYHNANVDVLAERYMRLDWSPRGFSMSREQVLEAVKVFARSLGVEDIEIRIARLREEEPSIDELEAVGRIVKQELGMIPLNMGAIGEPKEKTQAGMDPGRIGVFKR